MCVKKICIYILNISIPLRKNLEFLLVYQFLFLVFGRGEGVCKSILSFFGFLKLNTNKIKTFL